MIDWAEETDDISLPGRFVGETKHERIIKLERKKRERVITRGLKAGKFAVEIHRDMKAAGLTGRLTDVQRWCKYYRWKLEQEGWQLPIPRKKKRS